MAGDASRSAGVSFDQARVHDWGFKSKLLTPATRYGEHAHDVVSLTLTLAGAYEEEFEEERHICRPLTLQLKPRAVPHTTHAEGGAGLFIVHVPQEILDRYALGLRTRPRLWEPGVASAIGLACAEELHTGATTGPRTVRLARALLERMAREVARSQASAPPWIVTVERRLGAELFDPPRLGELARDADVHPVHLARVFRRTFGSSIGEWIRSARADLAVRALATTNEDVASIALRLGYYDQSHLGRDFRHETGWSPVRFRRAVHAPLHLPRDRSLTGFRSS